MHRFIFSTGPTREEDTKNSPMAWSEIFT